MCDGFNHGALQIAVAQICQSMGWDALQKSSHDLLTDVLQKYLEEIAKSAHGYSQIYSRTEPNLDDLNLAFRDIGVYLGELEDFVTQVDQVPFIHQLPQYPKPKPCVLHHPHNGEISERLEQYYDYLPPLVSKLLQSEDEDKATTAEDADTVDAGEEPTSAEGYVRKEIKTVAEETSSEHVAVKRPLDMPPGLENETKKRRVDLPFIQKGNRGNEMDILEALQGNLSSPSPTPSPDIWNSAKTFEIPPASSISSITATHSVEKVTTSKATVKPKQGEKKAAVGSKEAGKEPGVKAKSSPKKKPKPAKNTASPAKKPATSKTPPKPKTTKDKSPSPMKSPIPKPKSLTPVETESITESSSKKIKTTPKKEKKPANKPKKPVTKTSLTLAASETAKENIEVKESMPKLIIKPIKKETDAEHQFTVSEFLPPDNAAVKEKSVNKISKPKAGPTKKPKVKKEKDKITEPSVKKEPKEWSTPSTSEGLKFSMADFAAAAAERNLPGNVLIDPALEHKKKKKKRKEKDRDKEKKKDKSKKLKTEPSPELPFPSPIPRITVKLDTPSNSASLTATGASKIEPLPWDFGKGSSEKLFSSAVSSQAIDSAGPSKVSSKQEAVTTTASATTTASPAPKLTIKSEQLERTVVSQTLSTTCVHGYSREYFCPVCDEPDDGTFMIGCDGCDEWFHG